MHAFLEIAHFAFSKRNAHGSTFTQASNKAGRHQGNTQGARFRICLLTHYGKCPNTLISASNGQRPL